MQKNEILQQIKKAPPLLSVGVLTADLMNLGLEVKLLETRGIKLLHLDVMDGKVWSKITVGSPFVQGMKTSMLKDVHLLIDKPEDQVENFIKAGADIITFSAEYCDDIAKTLYKIGQMHQASNLLVGLSLNPSTPIDAIVPFIDNLDVIVLLAIGPDTGSNNFISELSERISQVRNIKNDILVFVDGAIKKDNIAQVAGMGPNVIITGSAIFDGKDPSGNIKFMLDAIK